MISKTEFESSLLCPVQFWGELSKEDVKQLMGCEVAQMIRYNQNNPHHCYDLFLHTLHTVEKLDNAASDFLRIAAFFHDIGKPYVATKKSGKTVFYGHANKSVEITNPILYRLGYDQNAIERICFFIKHHDDFISWVLPTELYDRNNPHLIEISSSTLQTHIVETMKEYACFAKNEIRELWQDLLLLCRADALSQAEKVWRDGKVIDSKTRKLKKDCGHRRCIDSNTNNLILITTGVVLHFGVPL